MKDPPESKAHAAVESRSARGHQPERAAPRASSKPDLESRIRRRRAELIGRLRELRADTRLEVVQAGDKLKARLSEVGHIIKEGVGDGWTSLGDAVKHELERWLSDSELSTQDLPPRSGRP